VGAEDKAMQSKRLDVLTIEEIESILGYSSVSSIAQEWPLTLNQILATELNAQLAMDINDEANKRIKARAAQGILLSDASNKRDRLARARARRVDINVF
jgi:hypothetical protein